MMTSFFFVCVCLLSLATVINTTGLKKFIQFEFITANYTTDSFTVDNFDSILDDPKFDRKKTTAIYSYGFTQTIYQASVREIVDAYLENGDYNFVLVNYNSILAYNILSANEFADHIAAALIKVFEAGYEDFHLIGFSLGGQVSGAIGRSVQYKSQHRFIVPRITGLDPGMIPSFFDHIIADLNAGDAEFVDTIHGETKLFGSSKSLGNASFWINGGIYQPSCQSAIFLLTSVCSHLATPKFWASSVRSKNPKLFPAYRCANYEDFKNSECNISYTAYMGLYLDKSSSGRFYLEAKYDEEWPIHDVNNR